MTIFLFFIVSIIIIIASLLVILSKNPIHSVLFLILVFFNSSIIFLFSNAEFIAMVILIVYIGAVAVLFLFVVMMLDINLSTLKDGFARYFPLGIIIAILMVIAMGMIVGSDYFATDNYAKTDTLSTSSNTKLLGYAIYTDYLYQFEIAGAILLVAIIAAISLSMSKSKITKSTDPHEQVTVRKEDRLRVVKMKTEKKEE